METVLILTWLGALPHAGPPVARPSPPHVPISIQIPMSSAMECLAEVNRFVLQFEAMRRPGYITIGCRVHGPEREAEH